MLWSMLFVIPGIVKSYEYRMLPYILADNPEMSWQDAFAESKELMTGIFYVNPYKFSTNAALYEALKYGTCEA